ncbi:hypothetical protein Misp03_30170 [Microbispora sp. NBRC 16548]|nr:hypothetical protein Misp03_30170 [Microbispora sp. NBRC 16548]
MRMYKGRAAVPRGRRAKGVRRLLWGGRARRRDVPARRKARVPGTSSARAGASAERLLPN